MVCLLRRDGGGDGIVHLCSLCMFYMRLFLFMHVGVHIVYLAASVLPRCIITVHVYVICV